VRKRDRDVQAAFVWPLAGNAMLTALNDRGYRPIELTSVMYQPLRDRAPSIRAINSRIRVRHLDTTEAQVWAATDAHGWSTEAPGLEAFMLEIGRVNAACPNVVMFLAELDGQPIAAGALSINDGVALLAGASTTPEARGQGAQTRGCRRTQ
jgi:hypothetical protein